MKTGLLYWITGLSGAGKTTIGKGLYCELKKKQDNIVLLDGDVLRKILNSEAGYSNEERRALAMQYARICKMLTDQGITVICCTIAMFHDVREWNRSNNRGYIEVFLDVPMEVLEDRDQKGLYSKLKKGESSNLAGVDLEVEWPKNPDIVIKNDGSYSIESCVDLIMKHPVIFSSDGV